MAVAASPGATPHGIAGAALAVGAAVPAGSLPSLLLRLGARAAWRRIMRALCFMWRRAPESRSGRRLEDESS